MYDPESLPQYFQVSVNVLEARKLVWSNPQSATSYVMVVLGRKKHRTTVRKNQEEPVFREYLVFEMYMSVRKIQRSSLWLAVMEPKCCSAPKMLGEATIDLGAVWAQPNHQVYHKWAQLSLPRDHNITGPVGFLKVDISIIFRGEIQVMPAIVCQNNDEEHLLFPTGSEQQRAKYLVTVHAAFNLPSNFQSQSAPTDRRYGKPPTTYVRVSFSGLVGKTAVQQRTTDPKYSEQISIVDMFPNVNQVIRFEVCSAETCFNRVIASTELRLEDIAHDGENGFLPSFGPSLLHMYGASNTMGTTIEDGPYHKGSLLVSVKTVVPYYLQNIRTVSVEPVLPIHPDDLWVQEEFVIYFPIFEISMLDQRSVKKNTGVAITLGEVPSDRPVDEEFLSLATEIRDRKLHYTGCLEVIKTSIYGFTEFRHQYPVLQLATRLPDFRFRMFRNNIVKGIISDLEHSLIEVEKRLNHFEYNSPGDLIDELNKSVDDAAGNILKYLDIVNYSSNSTESEDCFQHYSTDLDQKHLLLQKEEIEKIYSQLVKKTNKMDSAVSVVQQTSKMGLKDSLIGSRKGVKMLLGEIKLLAEHLRSTIHKSPYGWPDLIIWLLNDGSRVAYAKLQLAEVVYSVIPEQCGNNCGVLQTIYMKPLKCSKHLNTSSVNCYCITGKLEILSWMGLFRQRHAFCKFMPPEHQLKTRDTDMYITVSSLVLSCRAYIYRAKLSNENDDTLNNPRNAFVRLNALGNVKETEVKKKTLMPVWNQVLTVQKLISTTTERINTSPPFVLIEVYDDDLLGKQELLGRFQIQPTYDEDPNYVPRLQWYEIYKGAQHTGQILMSVQFLKVPEQLVKTTFYTQAEESFYGPGYQEGEGETEGIEALPPSLIPHSMSYKVDIYWWGLRDVNIARKPLVVLEIDELLIKSDVLSDRKVNSNFANARTSQIFESPLNVDYPPTLNIRLYDSSTFGRTLFLGTNVIKNPSKYIIDWLPKNEREASLKSVSIMSSDFCEVAGQMFYVKKNKSVEDYEDFGSTISIKRIAAYDDRMRKSKWSNIFRRKDCPEEELSLLPVYTKENNLIKVIKKFPGQAICDDWWMRFFQSEKSNINYEEEKDKVTSDLPDIVIYDYELEHQPEFCKFKDWCSTLKFYNGKKTGIPDKDEQLQCGILKAGIAIYRWPPPQNIVAVSMNGADLEKGYFSDHPTNESTKHLVRVYVVKAINLAKDCGGNLDPYLIMQCGKRQLGDRKSHVSNTMEPIFGKMYEFNCTLPDDYMLSISMYDYDPLPPDELIGSTNIDLEDRIYSKHRARVGLASEYTLSGPAKWRDNMKPSAILEELCSKNHVPPPIFPDSYSVIVNGVEYKDNISGKFYTAVERKENICLSILHKWQTLPICGYHLVPEHVETRSLYHPDKPGVERGKIQLWVDIFPFNTSTFLPPPRDITPRRVEEYELRVVVWDVQSMVVGYSCWKTADLYVRISVGPTDNFQQTDIHYNSLTGEGNFNWRMVFNFLYHHAERKIINKEMGPFTEYEEYVSPILTVQLRESNNDECLGSLSLNLNSLYRGTKLAQHCTLEAMESGKTLNLFSTGSIRAWWPLKTTDLTTGEDSAGGVIDLELTLLSKEKAILMPVGVGRNGPSPLPNPCRAACSNTKKSRGCCSAIAEFMQHRGQEILFFFVIVSVVWFLVYILYLALPSAENFISHLSGGEESTMPPITLKRTHNKEHKIIHTRPN